MRIVKASVLAALVAAVCVVVYAQLAVDAIVVRMNTPFTIRAEGGVTSGNWMVSNVDGGAYRLEARGDAEHGVLVTLTVSKPFKPNGGMPALISWIAPDGRRLDIPIVILGKNDPAPEPNTPLEKFGSRKGWRIDPSFDGTWDKKPTVFIPAPPAK